MSRTIPLRSLPFAFAFALPLAFAACMPHPRALDDDKPRVTSLSASPGVVHVAVGDRAHIELAASDDDGALVEVRKGAVLASLDPRVASVDDDGTITGVSAGETKLEARAGNASVEVPVVVAVVRRTDAAPAKKPPPAHGPLGYPLSASLVAGAPMQPIAPSASSVRFAARQHARYTATDLPRGLVVDAATGAITGTATVPQLAKTATITRTLDDGSTFAVNIDFDVVCQRDFAPPEEDEPDAAFVDTNGDGIDGMACGPVFVSPLGDDVNDGTLEHPKQTLSAAVELAAALDPPRAVYAAVGTYEGPIELFAGAHVVGGYDPETFQRAQPGTHTRIQGGSVAVSAALLDEGVTLERLQIAATDAVEPGEPSVGLIVAQVKGTTRLVDVDVEAGAGADGENGVPGERGFDGDAGAPGGGGCEGGAQQTCVACDAPAPGRETEQGLANGGSGGLPGFDDDDGFDGIDADDGAAGGAGGAFGDGFIDGKPGSRGEDGKDGNNGDGGLADTDGDDGDAGGNGHGGGGGGGGAGGHVEAGAALVASSTGAAGEGGTSGSSDETCPVFGGAGGSGGAGGAGGQGGGGGGHGGGSFGVVVAKAHVVFEGAVRLSAGAGGKGGEGAKGGAGGVGGNGAPGGAAWRAGGSGGAVGNGGHGGRGGDGGGGGGGSSVALFVDDPSAVEQGRANLSLHTGKPGKGGAGAGRRGSDGSASAERIGQLQ